MIALWINNKKNKSTRIDSARAFVDTVASLRRKESAFCKTDDASFKAKLETALNAVDKTLTPTKNPNIFRVSYNEVSAVDDL